MLSWMRPYTTAPQSTTSHIKTKLRHFVETGEIIHSTPRQRHRKAKRLEEHLKRKADSRRSFAKTLLLLRAKYDNAILSTSAGQKINLAKLKPEDVRVDSDVLLALFQSLMEIKRINKKPIDSHLLLTLMGLSNQQILDPYVVTSDVLKLLERDQDIVRAKHLCLMAKEKGAVGMNAVLQWCLERGMLDEANRTMNDRKKWHIPITEQTYVIYFSGLAKHYPWGILPKTTVEHTLSTFEKIERPTVPIFNACLSVLVKNFDSRQSVAWSFFDRLEDLRIRPTCQTFTILLNGARKLHAAECEKIRADTSLSASERTSRLFRAQADLVSTAQVILNRVMREAMPPAPPTLEEATEAPGLVEKYRGRARKLRVEIDEVFAASFVLCYINPNAGTSYSSSKGLHYRYVEQGLAYLRMWNSDMEEMFKYVGKCGSTTESSSDDSASSSTSNSASLLDSSESSSSSPGSAADYCAIANGFEDPARKPTAPTMPSRFIPQAREDIRKRTDARVAAAQLDPDIDPNSICKPLYMKDVNPWVVFPPLSMPINNNKAIYAQEYKRLIDFRRPSSAFIANLRADQGRSKKTESNRLTNTTVTEKRSAINKFLLQLALEAVIKLGYDREFYLGVWFALSRWGGLYINRSKLSAANKERLTCAAVPDDHYPELSGPNLDSAETSKSFDVKRRDTPRADEVDILLVENFIFKMEENFPLAAVPARFATELAAGMVSRKCNVRQNLYPRDKTFDAIISILHRSVHLYNDKNVHMGATANKKRDVPDNTPKQSLTVQQLRDILDTLLRLIQTMMVYEEANVRHSTRKHLVLKHFTKSFNDLYSKLYHATWSDAPDNSAAAFEIHSKIVHSGILLYKPKSMIEPDDSLLYSAIDPSLTFMYRWLRDARDLDENAKRIKTKLSLLFKFDPNKPDAADAYRKLQWSLYNHTK